MMTKAANWVFLDARDSAPGPQGRLNRPPSTISPGVGRRRRPIDGRSIDRADSTSRSGAPDQGKRPEGGSRRYAVACVPIMVGIAGPIMVVIDVRNGLTGAIKEMVSQVRHRLARVTASNWRRR
jgi:hypothetical protein